MPFRGLVRLYLASVNSVLERFVLALAPSGSIQSWAHERHLKTGYGLGSESDRTRISRIWGPDLQNVFRDGQAQDQDLFQTGVFKSFHARFDPNTDLDTQKKNPISDRGPTGK